MKKNTKILTLTTSAGLASILLARHFFSGPDERELALHIADTRQKLDSVVQKTASQTHVFATSRPASSAPKELAAAEVQEFVNAIDHTFGTMIIAGVNEDEINKQLSQLNERREAGVRALVSILAAAPKNENEVRTRISMVDYLLYRARWDEWTRDEILRMATSEISDAVSPKLKGAMVVERAEIIGRIAAFDWEATSKALQALKHTRARRVAAAEAAFALAEQGLPLDEARKRVKEIVPEYVIASQTNIKFKSKGDLN